MRVTASKLREDVYRILDHVLETGLPVEIVRHGKVLEILPKQAVATRKHRRHGRAMIGDPEAFVHVDWLREWRGNKATTFRRSDGR